MQRRCRACDSTDVRRSNRDDLDEPPTTLLRSRYYCQGCRSLFWVTSARTYRIGGIVLGLILALLVAFTLSTDV